MGSALRALVCLALAILPLDCSGQRFSNPFTQFDYCNLPPGYMWTAEADPEGSVGYYSVDPHTGRTIYVGPDGIFYAFSHRGRINPGDLNSFWNPHVGVLRGRDGSLVVMSITARASLEGSFDGLIRPGAGSRALCS
jgi:hypothetical protein